MKDFKRHIYVSDLDGTLLHFDETISGWARGKLTEMLEAGLHFTVATARSIVSVREVLAGLPLKLPVIEINGAFLSDFATMRHVIINDMDKDVLEGVHAVVMRRGCQAFVSTHNGLEDCLYHPEIINDGMRQYYDNRVEHSDSRLRPLENPLTAFRDQVVAMTVIHRPGILKELRAEILEEFGERLATHLFENPYSPGWWWLTIHDIRACKSKAIRELVEYAGLSMEDLTVFGDGYNDVNMFKMAPRAIAVENADAQIKEYATQVIGSNEDDSVVRFIADEWEGSPL